MTAQVELTDTFGGEANYSWVKRCEFDCEGMTDRQIILKAKKELDISGIRHKKTDFGDMIRLDFSCSGWLTVLFIVVT